MYMEYYKNELILKYNKFLENSLYTLLNCITPLHNFPILYIKSQKPYSTLPVYLTHLLDL